MIMLSKLEKIMEKNEFKKMMKKENKAFKNYYVYEMILILLLAIIVIPNIILTINNMIPFNITIINTLLIIVFFHIFDAPLQIIIYLTNSIMANYIITIF